MSPSVTPLSFGAEQLLGALERRVRAGGQEPGARRWLLALLEENRGAAGEAAADADLDALAAAARQGVEGGEPGEPLERDELEARASRRASEVGRDVIAPADLAFAILAAQPAPAPVREETAPGPPVAEEPEAPEAERREERAAPERPRTFRVFVSSTFSDLEKERNVLREEVYPALRDFCAERGARFQDIDLRWGVSEEASLDQQAMNICLGEIERCRELTPRPNFLVLLGNRYGWRAPPPQVPGKEFEQLRERVPEEEDRELLDKWYRRDGNAVPIEYRLRPRAGEWAPPTRAKGGFADQKRWEKEEARLREILSAAVEGMDLSEKRRHVYEASATEQEIAAGALELGAPEGRALCFVREIELTDDDPDPKTANAEDPIRAFVDPDQTPLQNLKKQLEDAGIPARECGPARWEAKRGAPTTDHLKQFAKDVTTALRDAIEDELDHPTEPPGAKRREIRIERHEHLDAEGEAHREFADERIRFFRGRGDLLRKMGDYLSASDAFPLVLHGGGGTGKSALLAEALRRAQDRPETQLVYRFIGATPGSSDGRGLLEGICRELARRYGTSEVEVPTDYQELSADFRKRLEAASAERPLYLFIDSLDQLTPSQGARRLTWIPEPLPEHVRLVLSTRPGETLEPLAQRLERAGQREARLLEVGAMSGEEGAELLALWLEDVGRTLQENQRDAVLNAFGASEGNPLYLRLAFEEARRWISDQDPEPLANGVKGIIAENTFARLADEDNHGEVLVSHALGYLAASRHGLAEDELVDLLSRDLDVYRWFVLGSYHVPLDLRERLDGYLSDETKRELRGRAKSEPVDEIAEWMSQIRAEEREAEELDDFLKEVLASPEGLRLPIVLWARLYGDLRPYLTASAYEDAILIAFYHRELGEVAHEQYLGDGRDLDYHAKLADYFQPELDGDGRPDWAKASLHGLSELPYHLTLAGEEHWDELHDTLTDFRFLEEKAQRVGRVTARDAEGNEVTTYTGVFALQDDFDRAVREMSGGEEAGKPRIIVTATDFGEGLVVRCPHCNVSHELTQMRRKEWPGKDIQCPNESCKGPLKVNEFVVERPLRTMR